jgi:hypothetical protein
VGAVLEEHVAQALELLVREAAVVRDDERLRLAELGGQLGDDPFLVRFEHLVPPERRNPREAGSIVRRTDAVRMNQPRPDLRRVDAQSFEAPAGCLRRDRR